MIVSGDGVFLMGTTFQAMLQTLLPTIFTTTFHSHRRSHTQLIGSHSSAKSCLSDIDSSFRSLRSFGIHEEK